MSFKVLPVLLGLVAVLWGCDSDKAPENINAGPANGKIDGGIQFIDGGIKTIDAGNIEIDGGVQNIDGGVIKIDGGVIKVDGGIVEIDGGVLLVDGGVVEIDGGALFIDGGVVEIDGGALFIDGGIVRIDGGVQTIDGGVQTIDGGVQTIEGGVVSNLLTLTVYNTDETSISAYHSTGSASSVCLGDACTYQLPRGSTVFLTSIAPPLCDPMYPGDLFARRGHHIYFSPPGQSWIRVENYPPATGGCVETSNRYSCWFTLNGDYHYDMGWEDICGG